MSTVALSRHSSRITAALRAVVALSYPVWRLLRRRKRVARDARALQMLPDNVLADLGLEKIEVMGGTDGVRHIWVIPHRYY